MLFRLISDLHLSCSAHMLPYLDRSLSKLCNLHRCTIYLLTDHTCLCLLATVFCSKCKPKLCVCAEVKEVQPRPEPNPRSTASRITYAKEMHTNRKQSLYSHFYLTHQHILALYLLPPALFLPVLFHFFSNATRSL